MQDGHLNLPLHLALVLKRTSSLRVLDLPALPPLVPTCRLVSPSPSSVRQEDQDAGWCVTDLGEGRGGR